MNFKDYFSRQAEGYARYRPGYPDELFRFLSSLTREHELAWDCACGSGQAANDLAKYYEKIIATDASSEQLKNAVQHSKITYKNVTAENSGLESGSVDLVTVAAAIHWFDTDKFYPEVRRIVKPGGVIALWGYSHSNITPEMDILIKNFIKDKLNKYWPADNIKVWEFEKYIDFPFERLKTPEFKTTAEWSLNDYLNFIETWSSVQKYIDANKSNPVEDLKKILIKKWGDEHTKREISWKLDIKVGRV